VTAVRRCSENALVFMAKWPEPGRAKTRLSPPLSLEQAAALARAFLLDTLAGAAGAEADCWLAFAPRSAAASFRALVGDGIGLLPAEGRDLGEALRAAQAAMFVAGYRRVALVSSDIPHLDPANYRRAWEALDAAGAVLGPSEDGGYYLLATGRPTPALFERITWSTAVVYEQTLARAAAVGLTVGQIDPCEDIDTAGELPRLRAALRRRPGAGHTLRLLDGLPERHPPTGSTVAGGAAAG
jgi:rSAM/selenodomain-associated transferase 1